MMEQNFFEQLKEIFELNTGEININDKFRDYEKWDSLTALTVIAMLDSEFGIVLESREFNKLITVGDLLSEVKKRIV